MSIDSFGCLGLHLCGGGELRGVLVVQQTMRNARNLPVQTSPSGT